MSTTMHTSDEDLVEEIKNHHVLHWNYRGYPSIPEEICIYGNHVQELYLKWNNIETLVRWFGSIFFLIF